jgi:hypothetical protein
VSVHPSFNELVGDIFQDVRSDVQPNGPSEQISQNTVHPTAHLILIEDSLIEVHESVVTMNGSIVSVSSSVNHVPEPHVELFNTLCCPLSL